jgi:hypothetical protein
LTVQPDPAGPFGTAIHLSIFGAVMASSKGSVAPVAWLLVPGHRAY